MVRRIAVQGTKYVVTGLAIWLLVGQVDGPKLMAAMARVNVAGVMLAFALYLVGQLLTACRWKVIVGRIGFDHSLGEVVRFYFIGMFFNFVGPSTLGGDMVRSLYLGQRDGRRTVALNTVLFDRISGLAVLVMVAVVALGLAGSFSLPPVLVVLTVASGLAMTLGWWLVPPLVGLVFSESSRVRRLIESDLGPFWRDADLVWKAVWISAVFHVLQVITVIVLGLSLGLELAWPYYFIFHPLVSIFSALPISLAGLGIREVGYVYFLSDLAGVSTELALAFGILWLAVLLAAGAVGGVVFVAGGATLPRLRSDGRS